MNTDERDPDIQALFGAANVTLADDAFVDPIVERTGQLKRRALWRWVALTLLLGLAAIPLEDFAIQLAQTLVSPVFAVDHKLTGQLLAPVNSLGGLFAALTFLLRFIQRRRG